MHDVFISYASEDKAIADAACARLEGAGIRCWIAPRDVLPGADYAESIIEAIREAAILVLVFSAHANRSKHVRHELDAAIQTDGIIIPFRVEAIEPSDSLRYYIGNAHWLDALTPPLEQHLSRLVSTVQRLTARGVQEEFTAVEPSQLEPPTEAARRPWWSRRVLVIGASAAFVVLIVVAVALLRSDDGTAAVSLDAAETASIRLVAEGTFVEPSDMDLTGVGVAGQGSGFIISSDGIAVTNNHVVTGATALQVYVGGSEDSVDAKIIGVSECADLAVIDLEGSDYPFFSWSDTAPAAGDEVRAAGFPGGRSFKLMRGEISEPEAAGNTALTSVRSMVEHDADVPPDIAGGPLLDSHNGTIVGVNIPSGVGASRAISSSVAKDFVDRLTRGNVASRGVNAQAVFDEEHGAVGVWVTAVGPGSAADKANVQAGDLIERLEGRALGTDGTMRDYCSLLQLYDAATPLSFQVLRLDGRYEGEFGGDALEPVGSLVPGIQDQTSGSLGSAEEYEYTTVQDDGRRLIVDVPSSWSDVQTSPIVLDDGAVLPQIIAAPSVGDFLDGFDTPGMSFAASLDGTTSVDDWLAASSYTDQCQSSGPEDYDDGVYTGKIEYWTGCGTSGASLVVIAAGLTPESFTVRVVAQLLTDADAAALDRIIQSFRVAAGS
jgi:serine protease Do